MLPVKIKSKGIIGILTGFVSMPMRVEGQPTMSGPDKLFLGKQSTMWVPLAVVAARNEERKGMFIIIPIDDVEPILDTPEEFKETTNEIADREMNKEGE